MKRQADQTVGKETSRLLQSYDRPGNIRELQNVVERAVIQCESDTLSIDAPMESKITGAEDRVATLQANMSRTPAPAFAAARSRGIAPKPAAELPRSDPGW